MNAGWEQQHSGAFKPITVRIHEREQTMWPNSGISSLFSFPSAFAREQKLDGHLSTFAARAQGVRGLGGTWDLVLIDWIGKADAERQQQLLDIHLGDAFLSHPDVLHVRFQAGSLYEDSMFWIELHNPNSFQRERMGFAEFNDFASAVQGAAQEFVEDKRYAQTAGLSSFSPSVAATYLCAASMSLANHFAAKRVPLKSIMELLARMNSYADVHACLAQLPDGGDGALIQSRKLALLFG